jgi:hypothetical protein
MMLSNTTVSSGAHGDKPPLTSRLWCGAVRRQRASVEWQPEGHGADAIVVGAGLAAQVFDATAPPILSMFSGQTAGRSATDLH